MKIEDILQALPSKEDIAGAVGLGARSSTTENMLTAFAIFGAGMILGAGLALLFAPKAGHEIRHDIAEKVGEIGEHLRAQAPHPPRQPTHPAPEPRAERRTFMSLLLLIVLLLLVFGGLPNWGYHHYGYAPSGIGGIILIICSSCC